MLKEVVKNLEANKNSLKKAHIYKYMCNIS